MSELTRSVCRPRKCRRDSCQGCGQRRKNSRCCCGRIAHAESGGSGQSIQSRSRKKMSAPEFAASRQGRVRAVRLRSSGASVEHCAGGVIRVRSDEDLGPYPKVLTDRLAEWAERAPERTCIAKRGADGEWRRLSYAEVFSRVCRIGAAL